MTVKALIEFFETYQRVPVEIQDICDHCIETYGIQDEIKFRKINMDPDLLLGIHTHGQIETGDWEIIVRKLNGPPSRAEGQS